MTMFHMPSRLSLRCAWCFWEIAAWASAYGPPQGTVQHTVPCQLSSSGDEGVNISVEAFGFHLR